MSAASILSLPILDEAPQIAHKKSSETFPPTAPIAPPYKAADEKLRDEPEQNLELNKTTLKENIDGQAEEIIVG
jgi:hypothetical protein